MADGIGVEGEHLTRLLESVVTSTSDAVLITDAKSIEEVDGGPCIVFANEAFTRQTGYEVDEVRGRTPRMLQCEGTDGGQLRRIRAALTRWEPVECELLNRAKDGREFWVEVAISPAIDGDGTLTHWVSIQRDITERRQREQESKAALFAAQERLRGAFTHAPIGMVVAQPDGRLLEVNESLGTLVGRSPESLIGGTLFDITVDADRQIALDACAALSVRNDRSRLECRFEHADGRQMDVVVHAALVIDQDGAPDHVIMHVEDVSERNAMQAELLRQALSDTLTQLPNRAMLLDRLGQAVSRRNRDQSGMALLFIDIDGFKEINDSHGHAVGDAVLVALARRLQHAVRPGDTVARIGGDEFVIVCEHATEEEAEGIATRLVQVAGSPHDLGEAELRTAASIGLVRAVGTEHAEPQTLMRDADAAMYEAKRLGGGRHVTFQPAMRLNEHRRRELEEELREAIQRGELVLHYQPQIDLRTGVTVGLEALVRWNHPERGLLGPGEFIPTAERSALMVDLGAWVLCEASATAAQHPDGPVVWVNLSARQLRPGLVEEVLAILRSTGLPPAKLGLELTESALLEDLQLARRQLTDLRRHGVNIAIDDFGTGYSSLAYLAELPVDTVKVDRSFTARLEPGGRGRLVIAAVLGMARALGLEVIVEGIEDSRQVDVLRELGVQQGQGFHLGRPAADTPARVRERWTTVARDAGSV